MTSFFFFLNFGPCSSSVVLVFLPLLCIYGTIVILIIEHELDIDSRYLGHSCMINVESCLLYVGHHRVLYATEEFHAAVRFEGGVLLARGLIQFQHESSFIP